MKAGKAIFERLPRERPGEMRARLFREKDPVQFFSDFTQKLASSPTLGFKLLFKGTAEENRFASSLGSSISVQQVPEVLQKLQGTQFNLQCESHPDNIPVDIIFELYDDQIEISAPDSYERKIMALISGD